METRKTSPMEPMTVGNWTVEGLLGEGGVGKVFLARHRQLKTLAALKALHVPLTNDPNFGDRFLREAQTQSRLRHAHIARVMDFIEDQGQYYIVIEYLAGGTLADLIDSQRGPLDVSNALTWTNQTLSALDYAHRLGVIHRDVKPSNILFDEAGNVKVADFGIAVVMGGRRLTNAGIMMGTPAYMSPEQIVRPKEVDHRSDIYSVGIVLYEMLGGRVPFPEENDFAVRSAHVNEPPPPLRHLNAAIPDSLDRVVLKALAKDPLRRYADCREFMEALDPFSPQGWPGRPEPVRAPTLQEPGVVGGIAPSAGGPVIPTIGTDVGEVTPDGRSASAAWSSSRPRLSLRWWVARLAIVALVALPTAAGLGLYVHFQRIEEKYLGQVKDMEGELDRLKKANKTLKDTNEGLNKAKTDSDDNAKKSDERAKQQDLEKRQLNPYKILDVGVSPVEPKDDKDSEISRSLKSPSELYVAVKLENQLAGMQDWQVSYKIFVTRPGKSTSDPVTEPTKKPVDKAQNVLYFFRKITEPSGIWGDSRLLESGTYRYTVIIYYNRPGGQQGESDEHRRNGQFTIY
jgi:eukaryotic-like serine/threonine-protein kinase